MFPALTGMAGTISCRAPQAGGKCSVCRAFLCLVLAAWRPAPALQRGHPSRRAAAALTASTRQAFQCQNRFLNLFSFLAQVSQHL
jgi:hypothetical protein